jgi:ribonuclease HI
MSPRLIIRTELASEGTPPWSGIGFVHPVDSDELADDLKQTFPEGGTLRERKHIAVIKFFQEELLQMQYTRRAVSMADGAATYASLAAPVLHRQVDERVSQPSHSPASSTCSAAPAEIQGQTTSIAAVAPAEAVSGQQFVFNAADGKMLQSKRKRKMTLDEKTAYKETRRRGACSKCKRQKGKVCWCWCDEWAAQG